MNLDFLSKSTPTCANKVFELTLKNNLRFIERNKELLWKDKSMIDWLKDGDRNTKFFHLSTLIRRQHNNIFRIKNDQGEWVNDKNSIGESFTSFFKILFTESNENVSLDFILSKIPNHVTDSDNASLVTDSLKVYSLNQIKT